MKYFLTTDGDSRTYIVPVEREADWDEWLELDEDDPKRWDAPDYAKLIEGGTLYFENPEMDGELLFT